ncbi:hypothetical protein CLAVI_000982 [Candidatus Clavichlamydia salmonicola]|uniref:hypothetical protein n=1 Tax=Candidatus Clavichlamydia salmonicola TaxID=469812 RepID=UPI001890CD74|nr:hypothetical protein [Candidatus Clavichlamydia salmonicola]MBF5051339.1 hypothetical protein [Candidatus Clavichlamydia salmonicola]
MGVVGLTTASLCAGDDVAGLFVNSLTSTTPPGTGGYEKVVACFRKQDHLLSQGMGSWSGWGETNFGICQNSTTQGTPEEINCIKITDYQSKFPFTMVPLCNATAAAQHSTSLLDHIFMSWSNGAWVVSNTVSCMSNISMS